MLIAHFDDNALLWDKLLKDISNKQKTKKAISGMINGDRPMRFPRARYIHFLTCTGMSLRKRFFCMMSGAVLCIFRIRCQIFDSFNFFQVMLPWFIFHYKRHDFLVFFLFLLEALFLSSEVTSERVFSKKLSGLPSQEDMSLYVRFK